MIAGMVGEYAISKLPFASVSKRVFMQNNLYENVFHLQVHFHANQTHFCKRGFVQRLILKQRCKVQLRNGVLLSPECTSDN